MVMGHFGPIPFGTLGLFGPISFRSGHFGPISGGGPLGPLYFIQALDNKIFFFLVPLIL